MSSEENTSFEITITNFATCCRLCFSNETKLTITNSYLESAHDVSVAEAIESVANITISLNEQLSTRICGLCFTRLDDAYCFIRDVRNNNVTIMDFFSGDNDNDDREAPYEMSASDDAACENEEDDGAKQDPEPMNAVDLVLREIAPAKGKARMKRESNARTLLHQCTTCDRTFVRKSNLIDHQRLHEQVKLFKCDYCSKSFVQVTNLRMHLRTHTAEKPYQCEICQKSFNQSSTLKMHLKAHANIRPHACDTCQKSFLTTSDLVKHKHCHSEKKRFQCVLCTNRFFTQKIHLRNHLHKIHKLDDIQRLVAEGSLVSNNVKE